MNKIFYQAMNKKNYFALILSIIGFFLIFINIEIPVMLLILIVSLFEGPIGHDIFVYKDKTLYLLTGKDKYTPRIILSILLFIGFILTLSKYYKTSLFIFYLIIIFIFINNIIIGKNNIKYLDNLNKDKILDIWDGVIYQLNEYEYDKGLFNFSGIKINDLTKHNFDYKLNKSFINYKELVQIIKE